MNRLIVRTVSWFRPLWERLGVDTDQLCAILGIKLVMDDRRPSGLAQARGRRRNKVPTRATVGTMLISLVMGLVYLIVFKIARDNLTALTLFFFMYIVMLCLTLVSDFTSVLIDVKDNYIILPKPVSGPTVLMSRLLHILVHLSKVVIPMIAPCLVYLWINAGPGGAGVFLLAALLGTMLSLFTINLAYLLILKVTTVERFKDIIGMIQVAFTVIIFIIYQLVPRMQDHVALDQGMLLSKPYLYLAAPLWLGAFWQVLVHPHTATGLLWGLGAAGLVVPPLCAWVMIRILAPGFDRKLSGLGAGSAPKTLRAARKGGLYRAFARLLTRNGPEATGFEVSWLLSGRNRDFKLRVYPSFAYVIVYFAYIALFRGGGNVSYRLATLSERHLYIALIYLSSLAMLAALSNMVYTEKYQAAWVYYVSPLRGPGLVLCGAVKAMIVKFFLPFYVLVSLVVYVIWGPSICADLLLGLLNVVLYGGLILLVSLRRLPFSAQNTVAQGTGRFLKNLVQWLLPMGFGFCHYLLHVLFHDLTVVIWISCVLTGILVWMVFDKCKSLSWTDLEKF